MRLMIVFLLLLLISLDVDADIDEQRPDGITNEKWNSLKAVVQETKLLPEPAGLGGEESRFGYAVSVDGDRALVGAPGMAVAGAAILLEFDGLDWQEIDVLLPSDGEFDDDFGFSVSLSGNRALVGAYGDDDNGRDSGSAYIYDFDGVSWTQSDKLTASDGAANDNFGGSLSVSGDRVLVGARGDDENGFSSGSAYVFDYDGVSWVQSAKLTAADGAATDSFGSSVSLNGDRVLISAPRDSDNGSASGSAYIFDYDGVSWLQSAKLTAADGAVSDYFGRSVSLSGDRALIGALWDDDNGNDSGSAYIFDYDGVDWNQSIKLFASDATASNNFGFSVSLSGDRALISALGYFDNGSNSGSAYIYDYDGASWMESAKLTAGDGAVDDFFGLSVSLSGDRVLVGAYRDDDNGNDSGSAYIYDYDGISWMESAKLTDGDGATGDRFGTSVSLSADRALVGAWLDDDNGSSSGSAYIFDYDGVNWSLSAKLTAADGTVDDYFGRSVSLSGNRALVGASSDDDGGRDSGSAYIFDYDGVNWSQSAKLTADDGAAYDRFGFSVSLSGDRALVGAYLDDDNGSQSGSVYIYDYDGFGWTQSVKLTANDGAANDYFGYSVSLSDTGLLVGAYQDDDLGNQSGSAYIFNYDGVNWNQTAKLIASDGAADDYFGFSVSLSTDRALVGAYSDDEGGIDSGSAYIFDYDGVNWSQSAKLIAGDGAANDWFGWSVSLSGNRVLVGAYGDDDNGNDSGSAYIYNYDGIGWILSTKLIAGDAAAYDRFGWSVSMSGDRVLVGAYGDDDHGIQSGSAYVIFAPQYDINVSVTGLAGGTLSLSNGGNTLDMLVNGTQNISVLDDGSTYDVDITAQPTSPNQICTFINADAGTLSGADVTVNIECVTITYDINISVTGLAATNTVSFSNGSDTLNMSMNGTQTLSTLDDGFSFDVDVTTQPNTPNQVCGFTSADAGTLNGADVTVNVSCTTTQYTIGGTVSGLSKDNDLILQNNGGDDLTVSADGSFAFATQLDDESAYAVTVLTNPTTPNQLCAVTQGSGQITGGDVDTVSVTCVTDVHTVGGAVTGLSTSNSVTLSMNGGDEYLVVDSNNTFEFVNALEDGSNYAVTVLNEPTTPNQTCNILGGSGIIAGEDITAIAIDCEVNQYFIGGYLTDLIQDNTMVLQNNGSDDLLLTADGAFVFATPIDDESSYEVTIQSHPADPIQPCKVINYSGSLAGDDVDNILISCDSGDDLIYRHGFDTPEAISNN